MKDGIEKLECCVNTGHQFQNVSVKTTLMVVTGSNCVVILSRQPSRLVYEYEKNINYEDTTERRGKSQLTVTTGLLDPLNVKSMRR